MLNSNFLVDKTALLQEFVHLRRACFNRPAGFGKSWLVAMLEELFSHGTEHCANLAIAEHWQEKRYPVISLSLEGLSDPATIDAEVTSRLAAAFVKAGFHDAAPISGPLVESLGTLDKCRNKPCSHN